MNTTPQPTVTIIAKGSPEHARYMRSAAWRRRRELAIRRASFRCATCGRLRFDARGLQVHHVTYDRLGCERDADLMVLCRRCHKALSRFW